MDTNTKNKLDYKVSNTNLDVGTGWLPWNGLKDLLLLSV